MKRNRPASILLAFAFLAGALSGRPLHAQDLPQKYQDWLKLVSYIILPAEKEEIGL
jgi:hypothetical protein